MVAKIEEASADKTLPIRMDGAIYTLQIETLSREELKQAKVLIHQDLLGLCGQREFLWHKLRQINGELDRKVNEQATHPQPLLVEGKNNPL